MVGEHPLRYLHMHIITYVIDMQSCTWKSDGDMQVNKFVCEQLICPVTVELSYLLL